MKVSLGEAEKVSISFPGRGLQKFILMWFEFSLALLRPRL